MILNLLMIFVGMKSLTLTVYCLIIAKTAKNGFERKKTERFYKLKKYVLR